MKLPIRDKRGEIQGYEKKERKIRVESFSISQADRKLSYWIEYFLEIIQPTPDRQDMQGYGKLLLYFNTLQLESCSFQTTVIPADSWTVMFFTKINLTYIPLYYIRGVKSCIGFRRRGDSLDNVVTC